MMVEKRKIRKGDTRRRQQRGVSRNFRLFRKTDGFLSFLIVSAYILISDALLQHLSAAVVCVEDCPMHLIVIFVLFHFLLKYKYTYMIIYKI